METLLPSATIQLKNGDHATTTKLETYFRGLFQAQDSLSDFPVPLDHVWRIGYGAKEAAVKALKKGFMEDVDYQALVQKNELPFGSTTVVHYHLSVSCLEYFVVRQNREVFEVYRQALQLVRQLATKPALPDFTNPVIAARAWADEVEAKALVQHQADEANRKLVLTSAQVVEVQRELAVVKEVARENQVVVERLQGAADSVSFIEAAAMLKIKGCGRTKLMAMLRRDGILQNGKATKNIPYQRFITEGYFEVLAQNYDTNTHGTKLTSTTKVTGKGLIWLAKKYGVTLPA